MFLQIEIEDERYMTRSCPCSWSVSGTHDFPLIYARSLWWPNGTSLSGVTWRWPLYSAQTGLQQFISGKCCHRDSNLLEKQMTPGAHDYSLVRPAGLFSQVNEFLLVKNRQVHFVLRERETRLGPGFTLYWFDFTIRYQGS